MGLKSMKRKSDIAIGKRFVSELYRVVPDESGRKLARLLGCSPTMIREWQDGRTPSGMYLSRILQLGGDVEYILTGRRKPKENQPEFLAELEEEYD